MLRGAQGWAGRGGRQAGSGCRTAGKLRGQLVARHVHGSAECASALPQARRPPLGSIQRHAQQAGPLQAARHLLGSSAAAVAGSVWQARCTAAPVHPGRGVTTWHGGAQRGARPGARTRGSARPAASSVSSERLAQYSSTKHGGCTQQPRYWQTAARGRKGAGGQMGWAGAGSGAWWRSVSWRGACGASAGSRGTAKMAGSAATRGQRQRRAPLGCRSVLIRLASFLRWRSVTDSCRLAVRSGLALCAGCRVGRGRQRTQQLPRQGC